MLASPHSGSATGSSTASSRRRFRCSRRKVSPSDCGARCEGRGRRSALVTGLPAVQHDLEPRLASDLRRGEAVALVLAFAVLAFVLGISLALAIPFVFAACTIAGTVALLYVFAQVVAITPYALEPRRADRARPRSRLLAHHRLSVSRAACARAGANGRDRSDDEERGPSRRLLGLRRCDRPCTSSLDAGSFRSHYGARRTADPTRVDRGRGDVAAGACCRSAAPVPSPASGCHGCCPRRLGRARARDHAPSCRRPPRDNGRAARGSQSRALPRPDSRLGHRSTGIDRSRAGACAAPPFLRTRRSDANTDRRRWGTSTGGARQADVRAAVERLSDSLFNDPEVYVVALGRKQPYVSPNGRYARVLVVGRHDFGDEQSQQLVRRMRESLVPAAALSHPHHRRRRRCRAGGGRLPESRLCLLPVARRRCIGADVCRLDLRVPLVAAAPEGDRPEPPLGRRELRAARRRLRLRRDRGLGSDLSLRDALWSVDGLRGLPRFAYARGLGSRAQQRRRDRTRAGAHRGPDHGSRACHGGLVRRPHRRGRAWSAPARPRSLIRRRDRRNASAWSARPSHHGDHGSLELVATGPSQEKERSAWPRWSSC